MENLSHGLKCGGYSYVLEYEEGESERIDLSLFTLEKQSDSTYMLSALLDNRRYEGIHRLRVKCING